MSDQVKIKVNVDDGQGAAALGGIKDRLAQIVGVVPGMGSALAAVATGATAVGTAFHIAAKGVKEFAETELEVAKLDAALAQVGKLTDETREKYQDLANELQSATGIADERWIAVLTKLTQFGARPESIGMDIDAVKNLAGIVGDLETATSLYAKTLSGSYEALARYGIHVDGVTEAQKRASLQMQLSAKGAGQLEAAANSLAGRWQNLFAQVSDASKGMGQQIAVSLKLGEILDFVAGGFEWWADKLGTTIEKLDGVRNATSAAAGSSADYATQLALVAQLAQKIAKATDDETAAIKRKQQAQDEIADAQMALDLARVDEEERSGRLSKVGAVRARSSIRRSAAASRFDREQQADLDVIRAGEQGLSDMLATRQGMVSRRDGLRRQASAGSLAESRSNAADSLISDLTDRRRWIEEQGGSVEWKAQQFSEIDRAIAIAGRLRTPLRSTHAEIGALNQSIGTFDEEIRGRAASVFSAGSEAAERIARRRIVYGLNSDREGIVARGQEATAARETADGVLTQLSQGNRAAAHAGAQNSAALQESTNAMLAFASQSVAISKQVQERLKALELQLKNSANR